MSSNTTCTSYPTNSPAPIQFPHPGYGSAVITLTPGEDASTCGYSIPVWLNVPNTPNSNIKYVRFDTGPASDPQQNIVYCYNDPPNGNDNLQCFGAGTSNPPVNSVYFYTSNTPIFSFTSPFTVWLTIVNGVLSVGLGTVPGQQVLASVSDPAYLNGVNSISTNNLGYSTAPTFTNATCPTAGSVTIDQSGSFDEQCFALEGCVGFPCMSCEDAGVSTSNFCFYNNTQEPNYPEFITMSYTSAQALVNLPKLQSELGGSATTNSNGVCVPPQTWSVGLSDTQCSTAINPNCLPDPYCTNYQDSVNNCAGQCCNQQNVCPPEICPPGASPMTIQALCTQSQCVGGDNRTYNACMPCSSPLLPLVTSKENDAQVRYICTLGKVTVSLTNNASNGVIVWYILTESSATSCENPNTSNNAGYCIPINNAYPVTGTVTQGQTVNIIVQTGQGLFLSDLVASANGCSGTLSARARQVQGTSATGSNNCEFYTDLCSKYFPFANFTSSSASMEFSGSPEPPYGWYDNDAATTQSQQNQHAATTTLGSSKNPWQYTHRVFSPTSPISGLTYGFCPSSTLQLTVSANVLAPVSTLDGCAFSQTITEHQCNSGGW